MHANWFWFGTIASMPLWLVAGTILGTFRCRHPCPAPTPLAAPVAVARWETERVEAPTQTAPVVVHVHMPALPVWSPQPVWAPPVVDAEVVKELPA